MAAAVKAWGPHEDGRPLTVMAQNYPLVIVSNADASYADPDRPACDYTTGQSPDELNRLLGL